MGQRVTIESIAPKCDVRGLVAEPLGSDLLPLQRNVHLVLTEPGHVRGNHFHERGTEVTLAFGPALFCYRDESEVREVRSPRGRPAGSPSSPESPTPSRTRVPSVCS